MLIGIPKEIKKYEYRVGATPAGIRRFTKEGHRVLVERGAGLAVGFEDAAYERAGAKIAGSSEDVYAAEMIVKVKEPLEPEFKLLKKGQILFCYLHLAPNLQLVKELLAREVVAIAYETVTDDSGRLPLLLPMSEIAGRLSVQAGALYLQADKGGKGLLLGGVPGVPAANVVIIGGGTVGTEAAKIAIGMGADVTILDKDVNRLRVLDARWNGEIKTLCVSGGAMEEALRGADLLIGAVLIPGKRTPKLITRKTLRTMSKGSVLVDVAIDQGGIAETSRPTIHGDPVFVEEGVIHYCVANMPGSCPITSTLALTNATLDYALEIAGKGYKQALAGDGNLLRGLNICYELVTNFSVAQDLGLRYTPPDEALNLI